MKEVFSKVKDAEKFVEELQKEMSINLVAKSSDDVVNGYTKINADGVEIVLYEEDEPANYFEGFYNNIPYNTGHKTNFVAINKEDAKKLKSTGDRLKEGMI